MKKLIFCLSFIFLFVVSKNLKAQESKNVGDVNALQGVATKVAQEKGIQLQDKQVKSLKEGFELLKEVEEKFKANGGDVTSKKWITWKRVAILSIALNVVGGACIVAVLCIFFKLVTDFRRYS